MERISIRHSFVTKICLWMLGTAAAVFVACFGTALWFASSGMLEDGHDKANLELDKALLYVTDEMDKIEIAANNFATLGKRDRSLTEEEVFDECEKFLKANPSVKGVAIGFEPGLFPQYEKGFSPYVMRQANGTFKRQLLGNHYDVGKKEWYSKTKKAGTPRWSDPFVEINGNVICSYCIPMKSKSGRFYGVLAVDMSLDELTDHVQSVKPYPHSYLTIMDRKFNFIVHPDHKLILKGTPMQVLDKSRYEVNETIFVDIKNQVRGIGKFGEEGHEKYLYYAPVKRAGWTITLECDAKEITADMEAVRWQMLIISLAGLIVLAVVITLASRRFLRPLWLYTKAATRIAGGNFHTPIPKTRTHNELWMMGNSLDHMQRSLDKYISELKTTTQEKGRIESELNIASKIQMSMIPKIFPPYPDRDDIDIFGTLIPAKAVGGDLYDFFLRDEKLFFCVGDVSGKGVPASLVMAVTRSLLRIVAAQESHPERIVTSINNSMSDMNDSNMFVTLFVGVLDLPTGRFRYCNAGHNAPVLISGDGKVEMIDVKPNLPVAILPGMKYEVQQTVLKPGDTIFMYTDGLTEAENRKQELFGEERMMEALKTAGDQSAEQLIGTMLDTVHRHVDGAEQSDDLTMIAVKYKRQQRDTKYYRKLTLHNDVKETPKIAEFMDILVGETGIDPALAGSMNLAIEEAVVNVMNYAYPKGQTGNVVLEAYANEERLKFVITDSGTPFDPTAQAEPDVNADLDDRPIGGLGIFLVRNLMDSVNYERVGGENILTLRKMLK